MGHVSLDYAKNHMGNDYGFLFQDGDLARRRSDAISYEYNEANPDEEDLAEHEAGFVRPLARVLQRLRLLGHTLDSARAEYQEVLDSTTELAAAYDQAEGSQSILTFDEFCALACRHPLSDLESEYIDFDTVDRAVIAQGRFAAYSDEFARVPWTDNSDSYWSESSFLSARLCIL